MENIGVNERRRQWEGFAVLKMKERGHYRFWRLKDGSKRVISMNVHERRRLADLISRRDELPLEVLKMSLERLLPEAQKEDVEFFMLE